VLLPRLLALPNDIEVLIVDDASPDGTGRIAGEWAAREPRIRVLHRKGRRGLGAAYRDGLAEALALGAEIVVQMDADLSHPPESLPELLRELERCDVVLGSRYQGGITVVNWPIERILLSYFGNAFVRRATGLAIRDLTGGFRAMRREALVASHFEQIRSEGYSFQIELNYRLARSGAAIREVPYFFLDRQLGVSKLTWRIGFEALRIALWLRIADALGWLDRERAR
jgi:dolichol-phosphate mannosyltransferase